MKNAAARSSDGGFTLVELIVCLGILSLMAALMAAGIAVAQRGGALIEAAEDADAIRAVQASLRRAFERAEPLWLADTAGSPRPAFVGASDRIRFAVRSDGRLEDGGFMVVDLAVEIVAGDKALVMRRDRVEAWSAGTPPSPPHLLLPGVEGMSIRYLGRADPGAPLRWVDTWQGDTLPALVAFSLAFPTGARARWPEILFSIPASRAGA